MPFRISIDIKKEGGRRRRRSSWKKKNYGRGNSRNFFFNSQVLIQWDRKSEHLLSVRKDRLGFVEGANSQLL